MKYGFEREYFVKNGGKFVLAPISLPHDDCGYLVEARGEPNDDPLKAAFLLLAEEARIKHSAVKGIKLVIADTAPLSPELLRDAMRRFGKGKYPQERGNLYGYDYDATDTTPRAGLHVHFSNQKRLGKGTSEYTVSGMIDIPPIVRLLDKEFASEIKKAKRLPGMYEIKNHGFEYRSLPASVDPVRVAQVLKGASLYQYAA